VIAGLAAGLPPDKAQILGNLTGALSVTSPRTINPGVDQASLKAFVQRQNAQLDEAVRCLLGLES
jgi:sugar/nucleoside kinase (ribokinase family)